MSTSPHANPKTSDSPKSDGVEADAWKISDGYRRYVLGVLLVVYVFNFIDRQILTILAQAIKDEIGLSDSSIGFLTGIAFALFYSTLGVPIARLADRKSRRTIIAWAAAIWSAMTAVTGLAQNFWQLAAARVGVGIGEAGCSPPAHSLLSDYFPVERRATALAIYALGIPIGSALGFFVGGWINEFFGWRLAFLVVGLPGVALAVITRLTVRDPPRGLNEARSDPTRTASNEAEPLGDVFRFMLNLRSFRHMSMAGALHAFYGYGAASFLPIFMIRVHGFGTGELGTYLALIGITFGVFGTYFGGRAGDWLAERTGDARWYMWLPALATIATVPFAFGLYLWPNGYTALIFAIPSSLVGGMWLGPTFAMTQTLVRPNMRATASAILLLIINLIGLGMGPWLTGALSDLLAPAYGIESIRYALLVVVVGGAVWSTVHYVLAARTLRRDLEAKDAGSNIA